MGEGLSPGELEQTRRSLVMSPSLPGDRAQALLDEVHRLRAYVGSVAAELDGMIFTLRQLQEEAERTL